MNIVDCAKRLPSTVETVSYAVLVRPSVGLHYPLESGVAWDGNAWIYWKSQENPDGTAFNDETKKVVSWVDPFNTMEAIPVPVQVIEEDVQYNLVLKSINPASKIGVIKLAREVLSLGLGEAKAFVESAPKTVKENLTKDEANGLKGRFEAVGGIVELEACK